MQPFVGNPFLAGTMTIPVEIIESEGLQLAYLVQGSWRPEVTTFLTPGDLTLQMGMIVYGGGTSITPHVHLPIERTVNGTPEVVVVREGACHVDFYTPDKRLVTSRTLKRGDILLLLAGGHGFRMQEDTVLFEVKQGPYAGDRDKERFA